MEEGVKTVKEPGDGEECFEVGHDMATEAVNSLKLWSSAQDQDNKISCDYNR